MRNIEFLSDLLQKIQQPQQPAVPEIPFRDPARYTGLADMQAGAPPPIMPPNAQGTSSGYVSPILPPAIAAPPSNELMNTAVQPRPPIPMATAENQMYAPPIAPVEKPPLPAISPLQTAQNEYAALGEKKYNKGVWRNPATGDVTSNPKLIESGGYSEQVTKPGTSRDKKWSFWDKVGSALVGWAQGGLAGGIRAGTDRNYFEKMGDENQRARLLPQIAALQQFEGNKLDMESKRQAPIIKREAIQRQADNDLMRYTTQIELARAKAKQEGGKWVPFTDPSTGIVMKQYRNQADGKTEPLLDPQGNTIKDPSKQMYDWVDPTSGQTVKITGAQLAGAGAQIATGNAQRTQAAATTNVNNELEARKANVTNQYNYSKTLFDKASELAKTSGEAQGNLTLMKGLQTQFEQAAAKLQALDPITDEKGYEAAQKNFDDLQEKFYQAASKTQSGAAAVQQMAAQGITRPATITAPKITPSLIKSGKPVPRSKDPLGLFR